MSYELKVVDQKDQGLRVVKIEGQVTRHVSTTLLKELSELLPGWTMMKVDLSQVAYVDSAGIAVFIQIFKLARQSGVEYRLFDPSKPVRAVLDLARLDQLFTIELPEQSSDS
jgi:anti-anti-sigma factor